MRLLLAFEVDIDKNHSKIKRIVSRGIEKQIFFSKSINTLDILTVKETLLSINNYYYPRGGAEVVFLEHNKLFSSRGWDVVPFSMDHPMNLETKWHEYFVEEIEFGSQYSFIGQARRVPKVIYSREARQKLRRLLKDVSPSICHTHNVYHHISPSIYSLLNEYGIPVVQTVHDLKLVCPAYKMLSSDGICEKCKGGNFLNVVKNRCIKNSILLSGVVYAETKLHNKLGTYGKYVDTFVTPSNFFRSKLIEWGIKAESLRYIPNFVEVPQYNPRTANGSLFAYFGRLAKEKGVDTLLKAAALAGVSLRIIGTGPEEESLKRLADDLDIDVLFTGRLDGEKITEAISGVAAVVLPSEWYENAPMSILESFAAGVPVIGADIGGIPELVEDGVTGFLFQSGSANHLAEVLDKAAHLSAFQIERMSAEAHAFVSAGFTRNHYLERMTSLYSELIG